MRKNESLLFFTFRTLLYLEGGFACGLWHDVKNSSFWFRVAPAGLVLHTYYTISDWLDVIQWFVGDVGGNHVLDIQGHLGIRLDDAIALDIDRP